MMDVADLLGTLLDWLHNQPFIMTSLSQIVLLLPGLMNGQAEVLAVQIFWYCKIDKAKQNQCSIAPPNAAYPNIYSWPVC